MAKKKVKSKKTFKDYLVPGAEYYSIMSPKKFHTWGGMSGHTQWALKDIHSYGLTLHSASFMGQRYKRQKLAWTGLEVTINGRNSYKLIEILPYTREKVRINIGTGVSSYFDTIMERAYDQYPDFWFFTKALNLLNDRGQILRFERFSPTGKGQTLALRFVDRVFWADLDRQVTVNAVEDFYEQEVSCKVREGLVTSCSYDD